MCVCINYINRCPLAGPSVGSCSHVYSVSSSADGSRQPQIKHVDDACGHVAYNDVGLKVEWSAPAAGFEPNKHHN